MTYSEMHVANYSYITYLKGLNYLTYDDEEDLTLDGGCTWCNYRSCVMEIYTGNLYDSHTNYHPNKLNLK